MLRTRLEPNFIWKGLAASAPPFSAWAGLELVCCTGARATGLRGGRLVLNKRSCERANEVWASSFSVLARRAPSWSTAINRKSSCEGAHVLGGQGREQPPIRSKRGFCASAHISSQFPTPRAASPSGEASMEASGGREHPQGHPPPSGSIANELDRFRGGTFERGQSSLSPTSPLSPRSADELDRFRGCLLGLAVGDALGVTVEGEARGSFDPLLNIQGRPQDGIKPGEWTDDTAMAMCLASSLLEKGGFDPLDQMNKYCRWMTEGYWSSSGYCYGIGRTTRLALMRFSKSGQPFEGSKDPRSAGNGSIMRLAPVPMFCLPDKRLAQELSEESSMTTHGAAECLDACRLFGCMILDALAGKSKEDILFGNASEPLNSPKIQDIANGSYRTKPVDQIRGTAYVVQSLEASLWCFYKTDSYEDAVLLAANLGDDADTTAAICGQLAGAFSGASAIPSDWLSKLYRVEEIDSLAKGLHLRSRGGGQQ